jgi:hypothetical protein
MKVNIVTYVVLIGILLLLIATILVGYCIHWKLGADGLLSWGSYLTGVGTILLALAASYAGVQAIKEYRERSKSERMSHLSDFFEKFYENRRFKRIRQKIDYGEFSEIKALLEKDSSSKPEFDQEERDLFDDFTDYLNFFEMIAYWKECDQIREDEMKAMFDYYMRGLAEIPDADYLMDYLKKANFEYLKELLVKYKQTKSA